MSNMEVSLKQPVCEKWKDLRSRRANRAPGRGHKAGEGSALRRDLTGRVLQVSLSRLTVLCQRVTLRERASMLAGDARTSVLLAANLPRYCDAELLSGWKT